MSEVDSQSPVIDAATLEDATSVSLDTSSQANSETHAEHEDVDVTELDGSAPQEDTPTDAASAPPEVNGQNTSDPAPPADDLTVDDITPPVEDDKKEPMASPAKPKVPVPIKTTGARSAGPPTPLVKKVCGIRHRKECFSNVDNVDPQLWHLWSGKCKGHTRYKGSICYGRCYYVEASFRHQRVEEVC